MVLNKKIVSLSDCEHVRKRPTIYVGSVSISEERIPIINKSNKLLVIENKNISVGFYKLFNEILDNAIDEAKRLNGLMNLIEIRVNSSTNDVIIEDNGGGFFEGIEINKKTNLSNIETAMSCLRAGSNFSNDNDDISLIGSNGVGAAVVNMLSEYFMIETYNKNSFYKQEWDFFNTSVPIINKSLQKKTGTLIKFKPMSDIFDNCFWDKDILYSNLILKKFLLSKTERCLKNLDIKFYFDDVLLDLNIDFLPFEYVKIESDIGVLYIWEKYENSGSISFVNSSLCSGIHQKIINDYINDILDYNLGHHFYDTFLILNLQPKYVKFGDQNKTKFVSARSEIQDILSRLFFDKIKKLFNSSIIYDNIYSKIKSRIENVEIQKIRSSKKVKIKISDKYIPSSEYKKNLFICEGASASGSISQQRNPNTDGIYALRGKIKNVKKISDFSNNQEVLDIINILNLDLVKLNKPSYERVIIATDFDIDGIGHIASLIINLFYKWFQNVITDGCLYILRTPLVSIDVGSERKYFYSLEEFHEYQIGNEIKNVRYLKGLGSLDSKNDWRFVFDNMKLLQIKKDRSANKFMTIAFGDDINLRKMWLSGNY